MINAGKKAQNCLGSKKIPAPDFPHRYRVKSKRFLYFQVRDPDNNSVMTIAANFDLNTIEIEGNAQRNVMPEHEEIAYEAINFLRDKYPTLDRAQYCGAEPGYYFS